MRVAFKAGMLLAATAAVIAAACAADPDPAPATPTPAATASALPATLPALPATAPPAALPATPTLAPADTPLPPAPPPIDASAVQCAPADTPTQEVANVADQLGYALSPTFLPSGFTLAGVSGAGSASVTQIYQQAGAATRSVIIAYPVEFTPDGASGPLGWQRPHDALNELRLGDQAAYVMRGGWSDASIIAGPGLDPDDAEWDYDKSLALFFSCATDDGDRIALAIQALPGPVDWISVSEIVDIAHSLRHTSR